MLAQELRQTVTDLFHLDRIGFVPLVSFEQRGELLEHWRRRCEVLSRSSQFRWFVNARNCSRGSLSNEEKRGAGEDEGNPFE